MKWKELTVEEAHERFQTYCVTKDLDFSLNNEVERINCRRSP